MEIKINLDLEALIAEAVTAEKLQPIVNKAISGAIESAIREATGYNSEFQKGVKAQLAQAMPHGMDISDVAKFQSVLNEALNSAVHGANAHTVNTALSQAAQSVMPDAPTVIKLSALVEMAREDFSLGSHESFFAEYEESEYGGGYLALDSDPSPGGGYGSKQYAAKIRIAFNKAGEIYTVKHSGKEWLASKAPNAVSKLDSMLLAMYVGRTRLDVDIDASKVEYMASGCDD